MDYSHELKVHYVTCTICQVETVDAVIVGASWAGIRTLHLLKQKGLNVVLVDKGKEVGGTWFYTRYPGCRVDTELPLYEFSMLDLWKNWNWSERLASRDDIFKYLCWVCDRLNLRESIRLNTGVKQAAWDEETHTWNISCDTGITYESRYFINCGGYATIKHEPAIPGLENFKNKHHSAQWPETLDCTGKRVGVIGTGASGLQIIEQLGPIASHLTVFQRTPNLATPARQRTFAPTEMQQWKDQHYTDYFKLRKSRTGFHSPTNRATDKSSSKREEFYEVLWSKGGLALWLGNYSDMLSSPRSNRYMYNFWREKVWEQVKDPATAEKLAPRNPPHAFGAKRPSLAMTYFETFNLPNVELVDVNTDPILEATSAGLQTSSKFHDLDVLILATGFDSITGTMLAIDVRGVKGLPLKDKWDTRIDGDGVRTYLGLMTSSFPNMFFELGPQSPSALGITPHMSEIQGAWIAECISQMLTHGYSRVEPSREGENAWTAHVLETSQATLMADAKSWYMGANLPDRKKQPLCYFGSIDGYADKLAEDQKSGYPALLFTKTESVCEPAKALKSSWLRLTGCAYKCYYFLMSLDSVFNNLCR